MKTRSATVFSGRCGSCSVTRPSGPFSSSSGSGEGAGAPGREDLVELERDRSLDQVFLGLGNWQNKEAVSNKQRHHQTRYRREGGVLTPGTYLVHLPRLAMWNP